MGQRALAVLFAFLCLVSIQTGVALGGGNPAFKIAVHVQAHPTSCAEGYPVFTHCGQIVYTYPGCGDIAVLPVFYEMNEYTMVETGISWTAAWGSMVWVRCDGDYSVGTIVNPGDGTQIYWSACQRIWGVAPGYGWLAATGPGCVCPCPNAATGEYGTLDCGPGPGPWYDYPNCIACAGVCGYLGDDPCRPSATVPSTWGAIKATLGN